MNAFPFFVLIGVGMIFYSQKTYTRLKNQENYKILPRAIHPVNHYQPYATGGIDKQIIHKIEATKNTPVPIQPTMYGNTM